MALLVFLGQAVAIVNRRELESSPDPEATRTELATTYADEHLNASAAAAAGFVDEVIEPAQTRARVAWALGVLERS